MKTGLQRNNDECYYTRREVAEKCISYIKDIESYDIIIEPSAGTGVFLEFLPNKTLSYDIFPKHDKIIKGNYLEHFFDKDKKILVVGNPPFGRQSCLAKKFIKHSCGFASTIAFILPKSFKKISMYNCFDYFFHKDFEIELSKNSFIFNKHFYDVPCIFQIWIKKDFKRDIISKILPNKNYAFVKNLSEANLAFRRVGGNAGKFYEKDINHLSIQSHYFIKTNVPYVIDDLNQIEFSMASDTVGQKSISKQDLIESLNKIFL